MAGTLSIHSSEITESAIRTSPPNSAISRPIRSMMFPTTRISAYMPITCAPMIGNTVCAAWCMWSTTTEPVSVITPTITPKLA